MALDFNYPITRTLPYRWFKWVVIFGGVILTAALSVLNLATTGYELIVQQSVNPNETITANKLWFDKLPLATGKTVASCETQDLQTATQFFTNKFGLTYTLSSVEDTDTRGKRTMLPSLQYLNNPLRDCKVTMVQLDLDTLDDRTASEIGWLGWGMVATVRRTINNNKDYIRVLKLQRGMLRVLLIIAQRRKSI